MDNGACYYHTTGSKYSNYEDLLVAVKKDADDNGLPFRYVQVGIYPLLQQLIWLHSMHAMHQPPSVHVHVDGILVVLRRPSRWCEKLDCQT